MNHDDIEELSSRSAIARTSGCRPSMDDIAVTVEATGSLLNSASVQDTPLSDLPALVLSPSVSETDAGFLARKALVAIVLGDDDEAASWARVQLDKPLQPR